MGPHFNAVERRAAEQSLAQGGGACPRCGGQLERHPVAPSPEVSYVRDRIRVVCATCGGTAVLDRRRTLRAPDR